MKKILVTGIKGFIGSNLLKEGVWGWDLIDGQDIFSAQFEGMVSQVDAVIHLAALTNVNESFKNPEDFFRVNVLGTARVLELCMKYDKKLVFPSSAAVYHRELSPYAENKAMAEDLVSNYQKATILRFFNVYGKGMNQNSGSIIYNFLTQDNIVIYGDGEQTRDFINVEDIADIVMSAVDDSWNGYSLDVGSGEAYSVNYIAGLIAFNQNKTISYEEPKREIKWSKADLTILKKLYKKPLKTNLSKDLKELAEHYGQTS